MDERPRGCQGDAEKSWFFFNLQQPILGCWSPSDDQSKAGAVNCREGKILNTNLDFIKLPVLQSFTIQPNC